MAVALNGGNEMKLNEEYIKKSDMFALLCEDCEDDCESENVYCDYKRFKNIPAADVIPTTELRRLRDDLCENGQITMNGLRKLNELLRKYEEGET